MITARNQVAAGGNAAKLRAPEMAKAPTLEASRPSELNQRGRSRQDAPCVSAHHGEPGPVTQEACPVSALINRLGRPLALGLLDEQAAIAAVTNLTSRNGATPFSPKLSRHLLRQSAEAFANQRALDEMRVRRAAWPLCESRKPGQQILAAADATRPKTMRPDEVEDLCLDVARSTLPRERRHGR